MRRLRVAVTGANGQIGSVLVRRMAETGYIEPIAICRNGVGAGLVGSIDCEIRLGSVADEATAGRLLGDCDAVVNCALASGLPKESRLQNEAIIQNLARVRNVKQVVFLSSVAVYGSCIDATRSTFLWPRPDTSYGKVKLHLERHAVRACTGSARRYYVLRVGHVYGANHWMSREIIDLARDPGFSLPFDGNLPTNTIHGEHLACALVWLISQSQPSGIYNVVANPQQTWRQVFDWHTQVLNIPGVEGMAAEASRTLRETFVRRSRRSVLVSSFMEAGRWLGSLPFQDLVAADAIREFLYSFMLVAPLSVERRLRGAYVAWLAHRQIRALSKGAMKVRPWHCSDAMPGQNLADLSNPGSCEVQSGRLERQLREWYAMTSQPHFRL